MNQLVPPTDTNSDCIVCGSTDAPAPLYRGIVRCAACGYVAADMRLTDEELFALYNEQFFTGAEFSDYASDERYFRKNFGLRFKELRKFINPARHKRLLEIGSAYGFFLDTVKHHFESAEGIDITDAGTIHARERLGLNVVQADFLAHDYGARKFDVVCMWDTVEHLREPHLYVEKIAAHTEPGALIFLFSCAMTLFYLYHKFMGHTPPGWAGTVIPIYFLGGVQIMFLGLVGEYIGKIYKEVKARPRYLKDEELF